MNICAASSFEASATASTPTAVNQPSCRVMAALNKCNPEQVKGLDDVLIRVNESDQVVGPIRKLDAHVIDPKTKLCPLHRAFSLFIFDDQNRLLLQKRSSTKITFPSHWTNSCCSHAGYLDEELEEYGQVGIRKAALRRCLFELNIDLKDIENVSYIGRIHYAAGSESHDSVFGEHEIDYILFARLPNAQSARPYQEEVDDTRYVTPDQLKELISEAENDGDRLVTPWFKRIAGYMLYDWWCDVDEWISGTLKPGEDIVHLA